MKRWLKKQEEDYLKNYDEWISDFLEYTNRYKQNLLKVSKENYGKSDTVIRTSEMAGLGFLRTMQNYIDINKDSEDAVNYAQDIIDASDNCTDLEPIF